MDYQNIQYQLADGVATITLNRPQALNALTMAMLSELRQAIEQAAADAAVRVVVITGAGRAFSSGADLIESAQKPPLDEHGKLDLGLALATHYNPLVEAIVALPKPVIAAVNGAAAGAAASLALLCDLTIAARSAYFLQAFVNIGLIPDAGGTWLLPRSLGTQRALGLTLLGERLPAATALDWGLIWAVADDEALLADAHTLAKKLAQGPAIALAHIKHSVRAAGDHDLTTQLGLERDLQRTCGQTHDFVEGVSAFTQKRSARFSGR